MRALVVSNGGAAHVLPAVRSLSRAGWTVGLGQPETGALTRSRHCSQWHPVRPAEQEVGGFLEDVARAVRRGGYDVVFPGDDIEVLALSEHREAVPAVVPYADHPHVLRALDKLTLAETAATVGIPSPRTVDPGEAVPSRPVAVKARLHWNGDSTQAPRTIPVRLVSSRADVDAAVDEVRRAGGEPLVQEAVDGELMAVSAVCDADGRLRAVSQQVTERTSLRRTSARARTVPLDEELVDRVHRLLVALQWQGLANLQFLRPAGSEPVLIDFNPRFYGSLALAVAAGADLPRVWGDLAVGRDPGGLLQARPGVRFSAVGDDFALARSDSAPVRAVLDCLRYAGGAAHSIGDVRDPVPVLLRAGQRAGRVLRRRGVTVSRLRAGLATRSRR